MPNVPYANDMQTVALIVTFVEANDITPAMLYIQFIKIISSNDKYLGMAG